MKAHPSCRCKKYKLRQSQEIQRVRNPYFERPLKIQVEKRGGGGYLKKMESSRDVGCLRVTRWTSETGALRKSTHFNNRNKGESKML